MDLSPTAFSMRALIMGLALPVMACGALADTDSEAQTSLEVDDDIERIETVTRPDRDAILKAKRPTGLKDGASLFISFDTDQDGRVDAAEIEAGIAAAFETADRNANGFITALEQQAWANNLRPADSSLANPVRFDPNLDRRISFEEFETVITDLAGDYSDAVSGDVIIADLKTSQNGKTPEERAQSLEDLTPGEVLRRRRDRNQS